MLQLLDASLLSLFALPIAQRIDFTLNPVAHSFLCPLPQVATQQYAPAAAPAPVHYAAPVGAPMTDDDFHYTAQAPVQQLQQQAPAPQMARQATFEDLSLRSAAAPVPAPMAAPCAPAFSDDLRNPQMVSVYVDQIMAHLRASETRHRPNEYVPL